MKQDMNFFEFRKSQGFSAEKKDLLKDDLSNISECPALYIITSKGQKFLYPNGESRVIYIGKADKKGGICRRLKEHQRNLKCVHEAINSNSLNDWWAERYLYMEKFGAHVYIYPVRRNQEAKDLESRCMWNFYNKYHATPVGNGARSFAPVSDSLEEEK